MNDSKTDLDIHVEASHVFVTAYRLTVELKDGRTISVPTSWYPRLAHGTPAEWENVEIGHFGLHWAALDEDISYKGLLMGWKSGESTKSLDRWLAYRAKGEKEPIPTFPLPADFPKPRRRTKSQGRPTKAIPQRRKATQARLAAK
jgi:hypothetical protein